MKLRSRAVMLAVTIACLVPAGCGSAANEEGFVKGGESKAPPAESTPKFQTQAEYELWRTEQASKKKRQPAAPARTQPASSAGQR